MGLVVLLKAVGTIGNALECIVTCEIVLTNMCGVDNLNILLTCAGNSPGFNTTMDQGPRCRCNWLVENQSIPLGNYEKNLVLKW